MRFSTSNKGAGKRLIIFAAAVSTVGVLGAWAHSQNVYVNISGCVPEGLYVPHAMPKARVLQRGEYVLFCPPLDNPEIRFAKRRGWLGTNGSCPDGVIPFIKTVGAVAGDTVSVTERGGIRIDGHHVDDAFVRATTLGGAPMPHVPFGTRVVPKGSFFALATDSPDAFDSRYYGDIRVSSVRYRMTPLFVWH